jgi:hypothetical protein
MVPNPDYGIVQGFSYLIQAGNHNYLSGTVAQCRHPVSGSVDVYQLAVFSYCIGSHQVSVAEQRLAGNFFLFFRRFCGIPLDKLIAPFGHFV